VQIKNLDSAAKFVLYFLEEERVPDAVISHDSSFHFRDFATHSVVERVLQEITGELANHVIYLVTVQLIMN
jgi:hypothetical protein